MTLTAEIAISMASITIMAITFAPYYIADNGGDVRDDNVGDGDGDGSFDGGDAGNDDADPYADAEDIGVAENDDTGNDNAYNAMALRDVDNYKDADNSADGNKSRNA